MPKEPSLERLLKNVRCVLETPFWIPELNVNGVYQRLHDDIDGIFEGRIIIQFSRDGDVWVSTDIPPNKSLRFRMAGYLTGGGRSPRTRNALMLLALAMKLDNEEKPDPD